MRGLLVTDETVVSNTDPLPKHRLHALVMAGWNRAIAARGKGRFADDIDCSLPGLDKQLTGSLPGLEAIDRALCVEDSVLDDWLGFRGKKLVDKNAVCDVDDLGLLMARVLVMIQEAEHPDGPGGRAITHTEYLNGESLMRQLQAATGKWVERCDRIRAPRLEAVA